MSPAGCPADCPVSYAGVRVQVDAEPPQSRAGHPFPCTSGGQEQASYAACASATDSPV